MKKILPVIIVFHCIFNYSHSQTVENSGKPVMQIITDFHLDLNDTAKTTGFGINRAYFGYDYLPGNNFSFKIVLNIGTPEDLPKQASPRRYAFFREASVTYVKDRVKVSFGLTTTRHFDYLQQFWGKRFISNEFEMRNKYGYIADLGVVLDYKFNDNLTGDIAVTNGEGYSDIQLDNGVKAAAGLTYRPTSHYAFRFYNDLNNVNGILQYTLSSFAGVDNKWINFGASLHYKTNMDKVEGHDGWGVSSTGSVKLPHNYEIFGRYDYSGSVSVPGETYHWNYLKDASLIVFGLQKNINVNFKLALDYQSSIPYSGNLPSSGFIFLNALFKI
jgi:hypothetical protein